MCFDKVALWGLFSELNFLQILYTQSDSGFQSLLSSNWGETNMIKPLPVLWLSQLIHGFSCIYLSPKMLCRLGIRPGMVSRVRSIKYAIQKLKFLPVFSCYMEYKEILGLELWGSGRETYNGEVAHATICKVNCLDKFSRMYGTSGIMWKIN